MEIFAVEVKAGEIKIEYTDGSSEEVEGFIYERKNSSGDTVEQRLAVPADTERLTALATSFEASLPAITAPVVEVSVFGSNIEIKYADGTKEEIANGIYERKDSANETIVEREATQADFDRLSDLADSSPNNSPGDDGTPDQGSGDADEVKTGSSDDDEIKTGSGNDENSGKGGDDLIDCGAGDDTAKGGKGNDSIEGGHGEDSLNGQAGDDSIKGGNDDDRIKGGGGEDTLNGNKGDDFLKGGTSSDVLNGGDNDDRLYGNNHDDTLNGGAGDDRLNGGGGNDRLDGGEGADRYKGGAGADVFVFSADGAEDEIKDFEDGIDLIDLTSYGFTSAAQILNAATEEGGDTYIDLGGGDVIKLDDVSLSSITADDFVF